MVFWINLKFCNDLCIIFLIILKLNCWFMYIVRKFCLCSAVIMKMAWLCRVSPLYSEQTLFGKFFAQKRQFSMFWLELIFSVKSYFPCYRTQETACSTIPGCFWSYQLQQCSDDVTLPEKLVLRSFHISLSMF